MTPIQSLLSRFAAANANEGIVWNDETYSYGWLCSSIVAIRQRLKDVNICVGTVVGLEADFCPVSIALLLVLIDFGAIVVPITSSNNERKLKLRQLSQVEIIAEVGSDGELNFHHTGAIADHPLLNQLKIQKEPGLILFSSGSTGEPKGAVHKFLPILKRFEGRRTALRAISFLLFDHIGGLNTLMYSLWNTGTIVIPQDRRPDTICRIIQQHEVELLPTSPTFINLLLASEAYKRFDLSSLLKITYGTEVMPESTLGRLHELYPHLQLHQTYGLSEVGILQSKSKSSDSLLVRLGGTGYSTRVIEGILQVKAESGMLGYLNAPSPYTDDGWFITGDAVEVDGDYIKILGRRSDLINVGGEKVYPAEVESVLQLLDGVDDVAVYGERHMLTGAMVCARFKLSTGESMPEFRKRMRLFCEGKLEQFKIPQKIELVNQLLVTERYKRVR